MKISPGTQMDAGFGLRNSKFTSFNVAELQYIAARSVGVNKCVTMRKLAEGTYNKTFRLSMDNGLATIARITHPIAGPK
ncbi:hypothetical protein PAAG_12306 [Paracoccidioides lutzii Pb01]|uniref:Aminoglycoside phosphotransferase domain-containing protein n=1 Tax=Paracoccidioides lutzii (strain ATCC MYA-826 / Pb01) TaxID=502779 RepID=A0A0A2V0G2_PARBA|nr:hypothetical protein PAAG_12306 [Paracoccidioides lutzii Pb01]KGQ00998.1 hypothetical protein PAAG_12306 [Paracoccidioides lutzii Pb01]